MTVQTSFFDWAKSGLPYNQSPWEQCSPNLIQLIRYLRERWGGYSLGCEADRPIRDGTAISSHAFGAAHDWRYTPAVTGSKDVPRHVAIGEVLPFVIANSAELHITAIHDYFGDRIWRAGRTSNVKDANTKWWKIQNGIGGGMGETWATYFHFETHFNGWGDNTPIAARIQTTPPPPPDPTPPQEDDDDMLINNDILEDIDSAPPVSAMNAPPNPETSRWFTAAVIAAMFKNLTGSKVYTQAAAEKLNTFLQD